MQHVKDFCCHIKGRGGDHEVAKMTAAVIALLAYSLQGEDEVCAHVPVLEGLRGFEEQRGLRPKNGDRSVPGQGADGEVGPPEKTSPPRMTVTSPLATCSAWTTPPGVPCPVSR